jgi:hypothetical protein
MGIWSRLKRTFRNDSRGDEIREEIEVEYSVARFKKWNGSLGVERRELFLLSAWMCFERQLKKCFYRNQLPARDGVGPRHIGAPNQNQIVPAGIELW